MLYSFDKLLVALHNVEGFKSDSVIPACPNSTRKRCAFDAGHCSTGDNRECEQAMWFFVGNKMYCSICVHFVYKSGTQIGYFRASELCITRLLLHGIITQAALDDMRF